MLCEGCETRQALEAAEAGVDLKRQCMEDFVLDKLIPKIVDADGDRIPFESRDDHRHMLGGKACDTSRRRRPDLLYVKRSQTGKPVAVLSVEVDEHSHEHYLPSCEAGKIDDTFQAIQNQAEDMVYCLFLKFNPHPSDVTRLKLDDRIEILAKRCNEFLNATTYSGCCMVPHVQCMFYHTKKGGHILQHFDEVSGIWDWQGNFTL
jgi:hypothetical protein